MLDIYTYSLDRMPKAAEADICTLRIETSWQDKLPMGAITLLTNANHDVTKIRFDVSVLDYDTKHDIDTKIRKVLKKHGIKFQFSNPSNPKLNFYHSQKETNP